MNEEIQLANPNLHVSVAPFAAEQSEPGMLDTPALPPGSYVMTDDIFATLPKPQATPMDLAAMVTVDSAEEGGRQSAPPKHQWRCVLLTPTGNVDARLTFNQASEVVPGVPTPARISLLFPEKITSHLPLGTEFTLWEGKKVGSGRVFMHS